jgi:hypothetical protein
MLLVSTVIGIGACVWRETATSYNSFIGACALSGIGAGPGETLGPIVSHLEAKKGSENYENVS